MDLQLSYISLYGLEQNTREGAAMAQQKRTVENYIRRYFMCACGVIIMALGVALSIRAGLGISPISCLPYALSCVQDALTVGQYTMIVLISMVGLQMLILRRSFPPYQVLQVAVAILMGSAVDMWLAALAGLSPTAYGFRAVVCLAGVVALAFGMFLEVQAGVLVVPAEGLVRTIAQVTHQEFGYVKVGLDCVLVASSAAIVLIGTHHITGIREGTVAAAVFVGLLIRFFQRHLPFADRFVGNPPRTAD